MLENVEILLHILNLHMCVLVSAYFMSLCYTLKGGKITKCIWKICHLWHIIYDPHIHLWHLLHSIYEPTHKWPFSKKMKNLPGFPTRRGSRGAPECTIQTAIPGHEISVLQDVVSSASPAHSSPLCAGAGLLHVRLRVMVPLEPHVAVQSP